MKEIKKSVSLVVVFLCLFLASVVMAASVPIPSDIQIVPPDPSLPKELAAFSGKWQSRWYNMSDPGGECDAVLIVEKIDEKRAVVIYCWGDSDRWGVRKGYTPRIFARISKEDGKYVLSWFGLKIGAKMEFWLSSNGKKLEGYEGKWGSNITMKRMP